MGCEDNIAGRVEYKDGVGRQGSIGLECLLVIARAALRLSLRANVSKGSFVDCSAAIQNVR
jgi:hypothetical protein